MNTYGKRTDKGTFLRVHDLWTPENWSDGYYDNKGRFRVYRPDYPRAYSEGYALRAHVVWWLFHGEPHPIDKELHHKDRTKDNDKIGNLEPLTRSEHQIEHKGSDTPIICEHCYNVFFEKAWRIRSRVIRFCSQKCYHEHPRSENHKKSISKGLSGKQRKPYRKKMK